MYKDVVKVHPDRSGTDFPVLCRSQAEEPQKSRFCTSKNTTLKWTIPSQYDRIIYIWGTRRYPPMRTWERLTGAKQFKEEKTKWLEK